MGCPDRNPRAWLWILGSSPRMTPLVGAATPNGHRQSPDGALPPSVIRGLEPEGRDRGARPVGAGSEQEIALLQCAGIDAADDEHVGIAEIDDGVAAFIADMA